MAKRSKKTKDTGAVTVADEVAVVSADPTAPGNDAPTQQEKTRPMAQITLTRRMTEKSGNTSYARPGVKASVYFNKNMFTGEPPETIEIIAENLTEPGQIVVSADKEAKMLAKAAKLAEQSVKLQEKAAKLAEKLAKAQADADKVAAKVAAQ